VQVHVAEHVDGIGAGPLVEGVDGLADRDQRLVTLGRAVPGVAERRVVERREAGRQLGVELDEGDGGGHE
jgi:hypothetical protein